MDLSNKKTFFLVTGASKGIGKCIAIEVSKLLPKDSYVLLLARSSQGLNETKTDIERLNKNIKVKIVSMDLSKATADEYSDCLEKSLTTGPVNQFERAIIIHNVGTLGDVTKKAKDFNENQQWSDYFHLNIFSVAALNSEFMKRFDKIEKLVVNITSKCAIEPFNSLTFYCSGKAAREMYFKCLASEETPDKTLVLNYSPGPVDTDMSLEISKKSTDENIKNTFVNMREKKQILTPIATTTKFIEVLSGKKFKSGDHIDYFEV